MQTNHENSTILKRLEDYSTPLCIAKTEQGWEIVETKDIGATGNGNRRFLYVPAVLPNEFGAPGFKKAHRVQYAYIMGDMANGISSARLVIEAGKAGMLGFFGAGGLRLSKIEEAVDTIEKELQGKSYGFNLLHNPFDPKMEERTVELYLRKGVVRVCAAAYVEITPSLVHYRAKGLQRDNNGQIIPKNHIFAKISRSEVARAFMSPAPRDILEDLAKQGKITREEAERASLIPMAEDITAEADSAGHTDRRPFVTLIPTMLALREEIKQKYKYAQEIRIGGAGGIATPHALAGAFSMGVDYVLTGSINQACVEADTSEIAKKMLAKAEPHDVKMAPAADMFEMGVQVQVLKFGTLFPMRAEKLYQLYNNYPALDSLPEGEKNSLEKNLFKKSLSDVWKETAEFFQKVDPEQIEKAKQNAHHKMALVFRWYLGKSSKWAKNGDLSRQADYQIWCGPAMGSFNEWVKGTFLENLANRKVVVVAHNLLRGAAILTRLNFLALQGFPLPSSAYRIEPVV
jgi:PfaD family protein